MTQASSKRTTFPPEVERRIATLRKAVGSVRGRSDYCQAMLDSIVHGCLGPGLDQRDDLQTRAVDIVGEVVDALHDKRVRDVKKKEAYLASPEDAKADALSEAKEADAKASDAAEDSVVKEKALCEDELALDKAQIALKNANMAFAGAKKRLDDQERLCAALSSVYEEHFVPLRDGLFATKTEADGHINHLKSYSQRYGYEESLICAFAPAARNKPAERGHFDAKTMVEKEKGFVEKRDAALAEIKGLQVAKEEAEHDVARAEQDVKDAADRVRASGLVYGRAVTDETTAKWAAEDAHQAHDELKGGPEAAKRLLDEANKKLKDFEEGPYEMFQWLKIRVAILEGRKRLRRE